MNNILIYAILGIAIGILAYMFSYEIKKSMLLSTYRKYINSMQLFGAAENDTLQQEDDANPAAVIQELNFKNTLCSDALVALNTSITKLKKEHRQKKEKLKSTLKNCNVEFGQKLQVSKKYRDGNDDDEAYLSKIKIKRSSFKD